MQMAVKAVARIVAPRASHPFTSVYDLWRRASIKAAALNHLTEADAFRPSLGLARREALWAIKALCDAALPLFAAAQVTREAEEPDVLLQPMRDGAEVCWTITGLA
ncbi:hypothetical protein AA0616_1906 [Komagataeibacter nataicola NRIC 0616]|nr:hypothetical protein AA0616_1906 [Komagataeibacter nataicola NRIC 0616]